MAYWLLKSEPETFALDDLQRLGTSPWDGVRNYQARNFIRSMQPGDSALFYHSRCQPPGVVGIARIVGHPYPDPSALDPQSPYYDARSSCDNNRWTAIEVAFGEKFSQLVSLEQLRSQTSLQDMAVVRRGNRLSVTPVTPAEWDIILALGK